MIKYVFTGDLHTVVSRFFSKFGPKTQNCLFKLKFDTCTISNMMNSMVAFLFSTLNGEYRFRANMVQKSKLSMRAAIWYRVSFEYAEFDDDVNFF